MGISSPFTWHGGKSKLSAKIIRYFPEHQTYVEPFGGSAAVLLAKQPSRVEVYNDIHGELVRLFQVLRDGTMYRRLRRALDGTRYARSEFLLAGEPSDDPVESARRFIVRQRQSRGGLCERWSYCVGDSRGGMSSAVARWQTGLDQLPSVHDRFRHVQIECEDWRTILTRFDGRKTLFYIDPPYLPDTRIGGQYDHELSDRDHRGLVSRILAIRGMVVLSGYAHGMYKPLETAGWNRVDFDVPAYSSDKRTRRTESLWLSPSVSAENAVRQKGQTPEEKMRAGAHYTHDLRVGQTTKQIVRAIDRLRQSGKVPTKTAVATIVGVSREHLSRRYRHLFLA